MNTFYILRLKNGKERVDRISANSLEEAISFFIRRKQMDEKSFNRIYEVVEYEK
tara:strand:- start:763 stop:924 length:162 start_codon:yes stop_codon:yes gene_type:complete